MSSILETFSSYFKKTPLDPLDELIRIIYADEETEIKETRECMLKLISQNRSVDEPSKTSGMPPLMCAFIKNRYWISLSLLEVNANPHIPSIGLAKGSTLVHKFINYSELPKIRLLLWYNPQYEQLLDNEKPHDTALTRIKIWDAKLLETGRLGIKNILDKTADDSKKITKLNTEAKNFSAAQDYKSAALKYLDAASIFAEHLKIEKSLKPSDYIIFNYSKERAENNQKFLEVSMRFYNAKILEYYCSAEEMYRQIPDPKPEHKKEHLAVLEKIIKIRAELQLSITAYRERVDAIKEALNPTPTPLDIFTKHISDSLTDHKSNVENQQPTTTSATLLLHKSNELSTLNKRKKVFAEQSAIAKPSVSMNHKYRSD